MGTDKLGGEIASAPVPGALVVIGSFQSLGILRSLAGHGVPTYLIDWDRCVGRFSRCANRFSICPPASNEAEFLGFIKDLAVKDNLRGWVICANDDRTVALLSRHREELAEFYRIPVPPWEIARIAYDKRLTYRLAEETGIPIPRTFYPASAREVEALAVDFPAIIKPAVRDNYYDRARKKAVRVEDRAQLLREYHNAAAIIDSPEIMVQELIPGAAKNLYSYGSLYADGEVLGKIVAHRARQHPEEFGRVTTYAQTVDIPEIEELALRFLEAMGYRGISEVEFMWDPRDGKYKLIEINARFWAWHSLAIAAGVDLPYLFYLDALGMSARANGYRKGVKWFRLLVDFPASASLVARRKLGLGDYLGSWRGKRAFAVLSLKDPLPFLAEVIMVPYILRKRGV